jgi:hypothetical protein
MHASVNVAHRALNQSLLNTCTLGSPTTPSVYRIFELRLKKRIGLFFGVEVVSD